MAPFPPQPRYFPTEKGRYSTAPGLKPLGAAGLDACVFQLDEHTLAFLENKRGREALTDDFDDITATAVVQALTARLAAEWPEYFQHQGTALHSALTGDTIPLDASGFAALCRQVPEDIAVVRFTPERGDWNAALHVSAPSHWAPEEKIGQSFAATHLPVPQTEKLRATAPALVGRLLESGPFVRFNWGLDFDDRLDCHPRWPRATFDGQQLWLRVERQVLYPLPEHSAFVFLIRVHLYPAQDAPGLREALETMPPETRRYKNLAADWEAICRWLDTTDSFIQSVRP